MNTSGQTVHFLRTHPGPFAAVLSRTKRHEVRETNDRHFAPGDMLWLEEWDPCASVREATAPPKGYTGDAVLVTVDYVTPGGQFAMPAGVCCMTISVVKRRTKRDAKAYAGRSADPKCSAPVKASPSA